MQSASTGLTLYATVRSDVAFELRNELLVLLIHMFCERELKMMTDGLNWQSMGDGWKETRSRGRVDALVVLCPVWC